MARDFNIIADRGQTSARQAGRSYPTDNLRRMGARLDAMESAYNGNGVDVNDQQRDRHSKGVANGYDDAIKSGTKEEPGDHPLDRLSVLRYRSNPSSRR